MTEDKGDYMETLSPREQGVLGALRRVADLFAGDGDLVRPGAEHHGVQVVQAGVFDPISTGNYNFRLPEASTDEVQALVAAKRVAVVCEDYRQVGQVAAAEGFTPGVDAVIGVAGGAAQPETQRLDAMADLLAAVAGANPEAEILLGVHTGVCGGANHFTEGGMAKLVAEQGANAEHAAMLGFEEQLKQALIDRGVQSSQISTGIATVEGTQFVGWNNT